MRDASSTREFIEQAPSLVGRPGTAWLPRNYPRLPAPSGITSCFFERIERSGRVSSSSALAAVGEERLGVVDHAPSSVRTTVGSSTPPKSTLSGLGTMTGRESIREVSPSSDEPAPQDRPRRILIFERIGHAAHHHPQLFALSQPGHDWTHKLHRLQRLARGKQPDRLPTFLFDEHEATIGSSPCATVSDRPPSIVTVVPFGDIVGFRATA